MTLSFLSITIGKYKGSQVFFSFGKTTDLEEENFSFMTTKFALFIIFFSFFFFHWFS